MASIILLNLANPNNSFAYLSLGLKQPSLIKWIVDSKTVHVALQSFNTGLVLIKIGTKNLLSLKENAFVQMQCLALFQGRFEGKVVM